MRIFTARKILEEEELDALLISSSINIRYLSGFDGFSNDEREGYALLTKSSFYIFADPRLFEGAVHNSKEATVIEFNSEKKLIPQIQQIIERENLRIVGFEDNLTYSEYKRFKKLKDIKLKLSEEIIEFVRIKKSNEELSFLQNACKLTDNAFSHVLKNIRIGMSEKEVAWEIEKYIRMHGGELAFPTITAFGKNSAVPHHHTGDDTLKKNSIILLDFGAKVNGYCADMTRTIFFGKATEEFKKMYDAVLQANILAFKPISVRPQEIDRTAREYIINLGYPNIPHSVGHGVGLQVHELPHIHPNFHEDIEPETTFTIEPGIYIAGYGGVRIEDTVYFNGKEILPLTNSYKNLMEL